MSKLFKKILVANRSEIAIRVMNACRELGIISVAVYSEADRNSKHRWFADEAIFIGPPPPNESYLDIDKIITAAKETGADAIHPGYGFLAENSAFVEACDQAGLTFIGPSTGAMELMGNKVASRVKMAESGIPLIPGMKQTTADLSEFEKMAEAVGYPVMIKAAAGGGGKGMRVVHEVSDLKNSIEAAQRESKNAFGDDAVYLEKFIANPRHVEFQILADKHGNCVHLFERECSIQRRHQKIIEETPSVALSPELRMRMGADAIKVAQACDYYSAGTVEFLLDETGDYYFLEMNTRIQVEHPVTEMVTGVDLVIEQIKIAAGEKLSFTQDQLSQRGHALECRIYAEDGENRFMPSIGKVLHYTEPTGPGIRVDSGIVAGSEVTIDYDPILSKLIVHAPDRKTAIDKMINALHDYKILGVKSSKKFMVDVLSHPAFAAGKTYTNFIETHMADRVLEADGYIQLAVALAAVASSNRATTSSAVDGARGGDRLSVWSLLGTWQIGDSISE